MDRGIVNQKKGGFTIIEVLIVLAIAGIIALTVFLAAPSLQRINRDNIRKKHLQLLAVALKEHYANTLDYLETGSGCGYNGSGGGWVNYSGGLYGPQSMAECLGLPPDVRDPGGAQTGNQYADPTNGYAYMKYTCMQAGVKATYFYANLEGLAQDTTSTDNTCCSNCDSIYGMNYYVKI